MIDVAIWEQSKSMTVHLVNLTNPMAMRGAFREIMPVGKQTVSIRVPAARRVSAVKLLNRGAVRFSVSQNVVSLEVPSIDLHEVIAVDYA